MFSVLTIDDIAVPLIAISFTSVIGLMAWMVRELSRISTTLSVMGERHSNIVQRIDDLEDDHKLILRKVGV
jgi:hypothetical protein